MCNKIKNKLLILLSVLFILSAILCIGIYCLPYFYDVKAVIVDDVKFNDEYFIGETVEIPEVNIKVNDKEYPAYSVVYYPDGKVNKTDSVLLTNVGNYRIEYRVEIDGQLYTESFYFRAFTSLYDVTSSRSSVKYGADLLMENYKEDDYTGINGINVSLASGDEFQYNQVIDLSDNGKDKPFVKVMFVPSRGYQTCDCQYYSFMLTDAFDSDNVVTIRVYALNYTTLNWETTKWRRDSKQTVFVSAKAPDQKFKGVDGGKVSFGDGEVGTRARTYIWGTSTNEKPYEEQSVMIGEESSLDFYYDCQTKSIYAKGYLDAEPILVVDLDEMTYQDAGFTGFTSDEVFFSMKGENYWASKYNCVLTEIDGQNFDKNEADASKVKIFVSADEYGDGKVMASVGKKFKIMPSYATDIYNRNHKPQVNIRVFENYHIEKARVDVPVTDNTFTPDKRTLYTIEYSVTGADGRLNTKTIDVFAEDKDDEIYLETTEQQTGNSGTKIALFDVYNVDSVGKYSCKYKVTDESGDEKDIVDGYFIPDKAGTYTVTVCVKDYVGRQKEVTKKCIVADGGVLFTNNFFLNDYYIPNKRYELPEAKAYNYTDSVEVPVDIVVTDQSGERKLAPDRKVIFKGDNAEIKYIAKDKVYKQTVKIINIASGEFLDEYSLEKLFVTSAGAECYANETSVKIVPDGSEENVQGKFINPLNAEQFDIEMAFIGNDNESFNFDVLSFYIQDAENSSAFLKISVLRKDINKNSYPIYINGNRYPYQKVSFIKMSSDSNIYQLGLSFRNSVLELSVGDVVKDMKLLAYGDSFNGFKSGKILFAVEMEGVTEKSEVDILSVCGQVMSNEKSDWVKPSIGVNGLYSSFVNYGDTIDLFSCYGLDVISGPCDANVSFITPSGNFAVGTDGTILDNKPGRDYKVVLNEYGYYLIIYEAQDDCGNKETQRISIYVPDNDKPQITVEFGFKEMKVGEKYNLPTAKVSDNSGNDNASVYIMITNPDFYKWIIRNGNDVTFEKTGNYVISYYAVDSSGNFSKIDYVVYVK